MPQANLTNYCTRFNGTQGDNLASGVQITGMFRCDPSQISSPRDASCAQVAQLLSARPSQHADLAAPVRSDDWLHGSVSLRRLSCMRQTPSLLTVCSLFLVSVHQMRCLMMTSCIVRAYASAEPHRAINSASVPDARVLAGTCQHPGSRRPCLMTPSAPTGSTTRPSLCPPRPCSP